MISQAGHHGGGSQLYPNQGLVYIKAAEENVLSRPRAFFKILSSICFSTTMPLLGLLAGLFALDVAKLSVLNGTLILLWMAGGSNHSAGRNLLTAVCQVATTGSKQQLLFLFSIAFMLAGADGEDQTGICELMDPAVIWDIVVNSDMIGLSPCSSTVQLPMQRMNICCAHVHVKVENDSPDPVWPPSPSTANVKVVVTVLAIIGGIGLAGRMVYKHWRAFTEADINRGLMREPAVPRRSDPTFEIPLSIHLSTE